VTTSVSVGTCLGGTLESDFTPEPPDE
jgi:hypothetical protein